MEDSKFKAGFVSIVGKPNVGKSTLMNKLVGENLSIITPKAQTTRHRITGILTGADYQIIYSDTPGIIKPQYELHKSMMGFVQASLEDADMILFVTDIHEKFDEEDVISRLKKTSVPILLVINKIDLANDQREVEDKIEYWKSLLPVHTVVATSALNDFNVSSLLDAIKSILPTHPPYYSEDELTDRSERFFASEIIREKIFRNYNKEVPYCTEVVIESFKEDERIIRISAMIYVERDTQKGILIGKEGKSLKKVGMEARTDMEAFFGKQVFLEQRVKVEPNWRSKANTLKRMGYIQ